MGAALAKLTVATRHFAATPVIGHVPGWTGQTDGVIQEPGDKSTYWKVPFEWTGSHSLSNAAAPADTSWVTAEDDQRFVGVVAEVLAVSPDASDITNVSAMGSLEAARHLIKAVPDWGFSRKRAWWQLLMIRDEAAGFVLPVTYDNCARDGLDEATIFHMGVVPVHRGRGLGRLLLRQATQTLVDHGVWRIYCDTASNNDPMIHLFQAEGWTQLPPHQQPI
jgi:ribosomal protein S18 acetylase RimI-like enzyme